MRRGIGVDSALRGERNGSSSKHALQDDHPMYSAARILAEKGELIGFKVIIFKFKTIFNILFNKH